MIQTSRSELLVDTQIHDPGEALVKLTKLMQECEWESSPTLTLELLKDLKAHRDYCVPYTNPNTYLKVLYLCYLKERPDERSSI